MSREFYETKEIFANHIGYEKPYTFEEWNNLPQDHKAAALFVQYFNLVLSAYYTHKLPYATEEECVETVLQYLLKNVPIIEKHPRRFTPQYVYTVCSNCIACVAYGQKDKDRFYKEISNKVYEDEQEVDIYDTVKDEKSEKDFDLTDRAIRAKFWAIIEDMGLDTEAVVDNIIGGIALPKGFGIKKKKEIINNLKEALECYKAYYYK